MEILVASSWISWLPPHCHLVNNYCLLVDNFTFRPFSDVMIRLLAFFFFRGGLVATSSSSSGLRNVFVILCIVPPRKFLLVMPTLRLDFVDDITAELVIHKNLLWRFVFFVFVLCIVTTFICRLIYCHFLTLRSEFYCILLYNGFFFQRYDRTSLLVILLEESFDQSCSLTDLPAAAASPCVTIFRCRAISKGLLLNNVGSTL